MLIDTNIFLEVILSQEKSEQCKELLKKVQKGDVKGIISTFSIDSISLIMMRYESPLKDIKMFISGLKYYQGLEIYKPSIKDRLIALTLIEKYGLDYEDAITLQSALSTNSKEILSFDKDFDKIKEIKRIEP